MTEEDRVLNSIKGRSEVIKNGVPITNELRDGLLAGERSVGTGNTALVCSLIQMGYTVVTQDGKHTTRCSKVLAMTEGRVMPL